MSIPPPSIPPAPPSASEKARRRTLVANVLTEHFRWAPEQFAKGGMDLANRSMYAATAKVEASLQKLVEEGIFDEEEVQRGIYRLETLLEDAIDTQFDLFEIFVLRNTFSFNDDLLPFITLPHQAPIDPSLRDTDESTLKEYEEELRLYEEELQKERELAAVEVFVKAKEAKVREQAELVGYLKQPGPLPSPSTPDPRIPLLATQLSSLLTHLHTLSITPSPSSLLRALLHQRQSQGGEEGEDDDETPAWASSRAAFINWAAGAKMAPRGGGGGGGGKGEGEDATVGQLQRRAEETGQEGDAKALLSAMT